jgi:hypothetical protein
VEASSFGIHSGAEELAIRTSALKYFCTDIFVSASIKYLNIVAKYIDCQGWVLIYIPYETKGACLDYQY